MSEGINPSEQNRKVDYLRKRVDNIFNNVNNLIGQYGWSGVALEKGGAIYEHKLNNQEFRQSVVSLLSALENYKDEKGKSYFADAPWEKVVPQLLLTLIYSEGKRFPSPLPNQGIGAFKGEIPREWIEGPGAYSWKLAQAITAFYPDNHNPFVNILDAAKTPLLFKKSLVNGENKPDHSLGTVIQPEKVGIDLGGNTPPILSPRQALGLLVEVARRQINTGNQGGNKAVD